VKMHITVYISTNRTESRCKIETRAVKCCRKCSTVLSNAVEHARTPGTTSTSTTSTVDGSAPERTEGTYSAVQGRAEGW
jgi:hypothetical protein